MLKQDNSTAPLPYSDVTPALLDVIYDSLNIIYEARFEGVGEKIIVQRLTQCAKKLKSQSWAKHQSINNPHVIEGIPRTKSDAPIERVYDTGLGVPRISRLCLEAAYLCFKPTETEGDVKRGILVPSPLAILVDVLTTPWRPESRGYGFAIARAMLFSYFRIHPPRIGLSPDWTSMPISDVQDAIDSFKIYVRHRDNVHHSKSNKTRAFLAHFLAMNGILAYRFGTAGKEIVKSKKAQDECLAFLQGKQFLHKNEFRNFEYEFRLTPGLEDFPDSQEILNSISGVPVPIGGADTVLFGGLQQSHHNSLVMSISGSPGSGKTSFALALAASLAPFGTRCFYCTFEEDSETLKTRALALVPQYFRRTTLLKSGRPDWLSSVELDPTVVKNIKSFSDYVSILKKQLGQASHSAAPSPDILPGIAPVLMVIDSLTTLLGENDKEQLEHFCTFVRYLRDLNCIVLLLSATDIPKESRLEYLVDMVIKLRHEGTENEKAKPYRLFQLIKSRLQMSRPGAHILHLSGDRGLRISPQLPSQLDSHKIHKSPLPESSLVIDTMRPESNQRGIQRFMSASERLINLYPKSKILIHGHGSSGKAAIALKILMASILDIASGKPIVTSAYKRPRILAISFLYQPEYYRKLFNKLSRAGARNKKSDQLPLESIPELNVLTLNPGYISPEDFINRVLLEMDSGHLEGWPYTGVLLDGLHNTFLQFPLLQANPMVWPALYSLLGRYDLTTVTTFTSLTKNNSGSDYDEQLILQGQLPFLHVLVQGTDFYLQVEQRSLTKHDRTFHFFVKSAIGQRLPSRALVWNADDLSFERIESLSTSQQELPIG